MEWGDPRYIALFGGFASGKTTVGCVCGLDMALRYPGITGAIIRNTYPELRINTMRVFLDLLSDYDFGKPESEKIVERMNMQYNWVRLKNGSTIYFLHTSSDALFKGPEFGWFLVDQAEEVDEEIIKKLTTRLRQPGYIQKGMFVGNTDRGHNWCYRWFKLNQKKHSELIEISFVDNKHNLDRFFFEEMMTNTEEWKKINLYGSWDSPGGLVIQPRPEHILVPFPIPQRWKIVIIIDPPESTGTCAALLCAVDFHDNYYVIGEYYKSKRLITDHAEGIKALHSNPNIIFMDVHSYKKPQQGESGFVTIADRFRNAGIYAVPTRSMEIEVGVDMLRERFEPNPSRTHPITGRRPAPGLYFFKENLPHTFEEIYSWMIEEPDREPCHAVDCLRYFATCEGLKPKRPFMVRAFRGGSKSYMAQ